MAAFAGFIGPSGRTRSVDAAADRCINLYIEEVETKKGTYVLYSMPGLRQVATLPSAPVRGLYTTTTGRVFATTATTLFEVFAGWSFLSRGTIPTGTQPVSMTDDGLHLVLSVEGQGFAYDLQAHTLTALPTTGPQTFGQLGYLDSRILTNEPGTSRFWFSGLLDALTWDPLAFYSVEGRPDPLVTLYVDHREVWLPGSQSTEVWYATGRPFPDPQGIGPFARMQNVFLEQGLETPWSMEALDNTLFWLGGTAKGEGPIWTVRGYQPVRISTHAVESALAGMPTVGDCVAFTARHGGHAWIGFDFPSGGQTWLYDTATQAWTEALALEADGSLTNYLSNQHCSAFGEHLWGDRSSGALYIWDIGYHKYGDQARLCRRVAPHLRQEQRRITHKMFQLALEAGVGLAGAAVPGADPQVILRWSDDGAHTWSYGRWRSAGKIGRYPQLCTWYQLGQARTRTYEVSISDPVKIALLGADLEVG